MLCWKIICVFAVSISPIVIAFDKDSAKLLGGTEVLNAESFPYQVSLRYTEDDEHFCGGVILNGLHILSAGHCFYTNDSGYYVRHVYKVKVVAGQINLTLTEESIVIDSDEIIIHPDLIIRSDLLANDIAVIRLQKPLNTEHAYVTKAVLASGDGNFTTCFLSGWGATEKKSISEQLMYTTLELFPTNKCQESYEKIGVQILEDSMLCADGGTTNNRDACTGDSGGPLMCNQLLVGIVSFGYKCGIPEYPGVYTNVIHFNEWIKKTIQQSTSKDEL